MIYETFNKKYSAHTCSLKIPSKLTYENVRARLCNGWLMISRNKNINPSNGTAM